MTEQRASLRGKSSASIYEYPVARRIDQFDLLASIYADLYDVAVRLGEMGIPFDVDLTLTRRTPVHDLPMEYAR